MLKTKLRDLESSVLDTTASIKINNIYFTQKQILLDLLNIDSNDTDIEAGVSESPANTTFATYDASILLRNYTVTKAAEIDGQENYQCLIPPLYSSLAILPNTNIFLVDIVGHCLLVTERGEVVKSCYFRVKGPYCATVTERGNVAVSLHDL